MGHISRLIHYCIIFIRCDYVTSKHTIFKFKLRKMKKTKGNLNWEEVYRELEADLSPEEDKDDIESLEVFMETLKKKTRKTRVKTTMEDIKIAEGYIDLPKEVIIECLAFEGVSLKYGTNNGRHETYYHCVDPQCKYKLKIHENSEKMKELTTASLIRNFKNVDLTKIADSQNGICKVSIFNHHNDNHDKKLIDSQKDKILSKFSS